MSQPVIEVQNLSYAYPGAAIKAVDDVSFSIPKGEIFGLLGPSGAGKSTIQRMLTRQIRRIDEGNISVFGKDIRKWGHRYFARIGVGFELPNHYLKLTALENLKFFASLYPGPSQDPMTLLAKVGLADAATKRVSEFSKGMQVRLNFVRALLHDPELLFLDEPMSGLDPTTAHHLRDIIADLPRQGKTIVLTTHNMYDAEALCDRVGFLANAQMMALDTPDALKAQYGERSVEVVIDQGDEQISKTFPLDGLDTDNAFQEFISGQRIHSIHSQEATLDAVFQKVTGETLTGFGG